MAKKVLKSKRGYLWMKGKQAKFDGNRKQAYEYEEGTVRAVIELYAKVGVKLEAEDA